MKNKYDIIVIGAGIGGLVCGCYLAKAGKKVLIVEQHDKPGGYCTSFNRRGYQFDAAVHSLRGLKENNQLGIVFNDFGIDKNVVLNRINPSDTIVFKEKKICVFNDYKDTIDSFKCAFPGQRKEIDAFFSFMVSTDFVKLYKLAYNKTFSEVLDCYFSDIHIKTCFNILLGNLGLDACHISAISAIVFYNELFTDSGYYPANGMQSFPDLLAKKFEEYGGRILLRSEVTKIELAGNSVDGVFLSDDTFVKGQSIVSNIDATKTYLELIGATRISENIKKKAKNLKLSPSAIIMYLGLGDKYSYDEKCGTLWYFPTLESVKCYEESFFNNKAMCGEYVIIGLSSMHRNSSSKTSINLINVLPAQQKQLSKFEKDTFSEKILKRAKEILKFDDSDIRIKEIATPQTLNRYTCNRGGSLYGWASIPDQIGKKIMPQVSSEIKNLYLCGHWATRGWGQGGISMVANSGRTTAQTILHNKA